MAELIEQPPGPETYCADLSSADGEPMTGTAARVDTWFLLEYPGTWRARATGDNDLPAPIQAWLNDQLAQVEHGRLQFIKQARSPGERGLSFFVAQTSETAPLLYHFRLEDYRDLLTLDIPSLLAGDRAYDGHLRSEPLYLVCTNGRRDRCCARLGVALYRALAERAGPAAWQSTHLGGHRFAPTLVTFPDGAYYGRLARADLESFIAAQDQGQLYSSHLRGRCCYEKVVQAADTFLRLETGISDRASYRLIDFHQMKEEARWAVRFKGPGAGQIHRLTLSVETTTGERLVSCSPFKTEAVARFRLVAHEHLAP
jgi:hypothetical protein